VIKLWKEQTFDPNLPAILAAAGTIIIGWGASGAAAALIFRIGSILNRLFAERSVITAESMLDIRPEIVNAVKSGAIVKMSAGKIAVAMYLRCPCNTIDLTDRHGRRFNGG
jgi:cation transport ATPase